MKVQRTVLLAGALSLGALLLAQSKYKSQQFVGNWSGTFQLVESKLPKGMTKAQIAEAKKSFIGMTFTLNFKANGDFEANVKTKSGSEVTKGKWFVKGNQLVTIDYSKDGKPLPNAGKREDKLNILSLSQNEFRAEPADPTPIVIIMKRK